MWVWMFVCPRVYPEFFDLQPHKTLKIYHICMHTCNVLLCVCVSVGVWVSVHQKVQLFVYQSNMILWYTNNCAFWCMDVFLVLFLHINSFFLFPLIYSFIYLQWRCHNFVVVARLRLEFNLGWHKNQCLVHFSFCIAQSCRLYCNNFGHSLFHQLTKPTVSDFMH